MGHETGHRKMGTRHTLHRLNVRFVSTVTTPGKYRDGGLLMLRVDRLGNKSFGLVYTYHGREHYLGLGRVADLSLADARERAATARQQLARGICPRTERRAALQASVGSISFQAATTQYYDQHQAAWSGSHRRDWLNGMETHVWPVIGSLPVNLIGVAEIVLVLNGSPSLWREKTVTGQKIRQQIEAVIDWATARQFRTGPNPALWKGLLETMLPKPSALHTTQNHKAMPWADAPAFMAQLRQHQDLAARALEFVVLNASRIGEVLGAVWSEFDLEAGLWLIPASRMKNGEPHEVPLSSRAVEILRAMPRTGDRVFPISRPWVTRFFREHLGVSEQVATIHGFRSSFRDWCADATTFEDDACEGCLAHKIRSRTKRAYQRSSQLAKRALIMQSWSDYCAGKSAGRVLMLVKEAA
jgi:integrase